jgi:hypothetical protein
VSLTEADKDRVAAVFHEAWEHYASGDPSMWQGGHPEDKFVEALGDLGQEEGAYLLSLLGQRPAR